METADSFIVVLIFFISFIIRIWNIAIPNCIVFDEFHFGQFINDYVNHNFFFDIHPPLGKLIYYLFAKLTHYNGLLSFQDVNSSYINESFIFFRIIPAIFTSFVSSFVYIILRNSSISIIPSLLTSTLIIFETSMISQSRFILIEGIQHFFVCLHLLTLTFSKSILLIGISLGLSVSVKMTSFSLLPFSLIFLFITCIQHDLSRKLDKKIKKSFLKILSVFLVAFIVFISITMIHLSLLTNVTNDAIEFLPIDLYNDLFSHRKSEFKKAVKNSIKMNFLMNEINQRNKQVHPYSSLPIDWPLLTGIWVGMWNDDSNSRQVNCMGNAFVFYFCFFGIIKRIIQLTSSFASFISSVKRGGNLFESILSIRIDVASFAFFGWMLSYFPFFFVKRTLFLYHYQISMLFSIINFGFVISKSTFLICILASFLSVFGFLYWKPLLYGLSLSEEELNRRVWMSRWRYGDPRHRKLIETFFEGFQF